MFEVLEGGIQTTVQDFPGRVGYLALGTYPAGPMDHFAFRVANLLVGNSQGTAALEVTVGGLKKGDRVPLGRGDGIDRLIGRRLRPSLRPPYASHWEIEAMRGPQADPDYLTPADMQFFFSHAWKVDRNSNRMGVRLESHKWQWARTSGGIAGGHPSNILDNGYAVWTVNVC